MTDPAQALLDPANVPREIKRQAWDAYYGASSPEDLDQRLSGLNMPTSLRQQLRQSRFGSPSQAPPAGQRGANRMLDVVESVGGFGMGMTVGALKEASRRAFQLGRLARATPGLGTILKQIEPDPTGTFRREPSDLEPQGTAQKVGALAEQTGEFALTGAASLPGRATATLAQFPRLARAVQAGKLLGTGTATAAAQGSEHPLVAGAVTALGGGPGPRAAERLERGAERSVIKGLGPRTARYRALAEKIAGQVVQRGITPLSRNRLVQQAVEKTEEVGQLISQMYERFGDRPVNVQPIVEGLEQLKNRFQNLVPTKRTIEGELETVQLHRPIVRALSALQTMIQRHGDNPPIHQVKKIRDAWNFVVDPKGVYAEKAGERAGRALPAEAWAMKEGLPFVRRQLNEALPDDAQATMLNKEYGFWQDLRQVADAARKREQLHEEILPYFSAKWYLARRAWEISRAPAIRLMSAQIKHRLAQAIVQGKAEVATRIITSFGGAVTVGQTRREATQSQAEPQAVGARP